MSLNSELERILSQHASMKEKLYSLSLWDKISQSKTPDDPKVKVHSTFIDGLISYYLENIEIREKSEEHTIQRIMAWSMGKLLENYETFLEKRKEKYLLEHLKEPLAEARELRDIMAEEIRYKPKENEKNASLITPKLPNVGERKIEGGRIIKISWPHETFLEKRVYASKPYRDSPIKDVNKVKKYLRMMGAKVLDKYTDNKGSPADIVIVAETNTESKKKFPHSKRMSYTEFQKILSEYLPEEVPAHIGERVKTYWAVMPNNLSPLVTTEKKKFYNLENVMDKKFSPIIKDLSIPYEAEEMITTYIRNLLKNVADVYIGNLQERTVIPKWRHSHL